MPEELTGKRCSGCAEYKPRQAFASNRSMREGLQTYCRKRSAEYHQQRQLARGRNVRSKVMTPVGHKFCRRCQEIKSHSEWDRNSSTSDGLSTRCKTCRVVEGQAGRLKRKCGMTEAGRDELIASQRGVCPICLSAPAQHVDHCHETGRVRGVLCFNCNFAMGKLES